MGWFNDRVRGRGLSRALVAHLGRSTLLNIQRARDDLGYLPFVPMDDGMAKLAAWIEKEGGADAIAKMGKRPAKDEDVADAIAKAGG